MTDTTIPDQYGKRRAAEAPREPMRDIYEIGKAAAGAVDASTIKLIEDAKKAADAAEEIAGMIRTYVEELETAYKAHSAELVERVLAFAQTNKAVQTSLLTHIAAITQLGAPIEEVRANGQLREQLSQHEKQETKE